MVLNSPGVSHQHNMNQSQGHVPYMYGNAIVQIGNNYVVFGIVSVCEKDSTNVFKTHGQIIAVPL